MIKLTIIYIYKNTRHVSCDVKSFNPYICVCVCGGGGRRGGGIDKTQ